VERAIALLSAKTYGHHARSDALDLRLSSLRTGALDVLECFLAAIDDDAVYFSPAQVAAIGRTANDIVSNAPGITSALTRNAAERVCRALTGHVLRAREIT
jgi:hypothetical protein